MWEWLLSTIYGTGFFITGRITYVYYRNNDPASETADRTWAALHGLLWPIVASIAGIYQLLKHTMFRPTKQDRLDRARTLQAEREQRIADRQERARREALEAGLPWPEENPYA